MRSSWSWSTVSDREGQEEERDDGVPLSRFRTDIEVTLRLKDLALYMEHEGEVETEFRRWLQDAVGRVEVKAIKVWDVYEDR